MKYANLRIYLSFLSPFFFLLQKKIKRNNGVFLIAVVKIQLQFVILNKDKLLSLTKETWPVPNDQKVPCLSFKLPERLRIV